jgi:hypothetical protein
VIYYLRGKLIYNFIEIKGLITKLYDRILKQHHPRREFSPTRLLYIHDKKLITIDNMVSYIDNALNLHRNVSPLCKTYGYII